MSRTFAERKEMILNALIERRGIQWLTDQAAEILGNPVFLYDISGKVLSMSHRPGDEDVWEQLIPGGRLVASNLKETESEGILSKLLDQDSPLLGKFPFSPYRFMGCRVRDKDGAVGIATIVEKEPFRKDDEELLVILCKTFLFEMLYRERTAMQTIPYFGIFRDILENTALEQDILERCKALHLEFPGTMQLIGVKGGQRQNTLSLYFARETIMNILPSAYCIVYDEGLIIVTDKRYVTPGFLNKIRSTVPGEETQIGISQPFDEIIKLRDAYEELLAIRDVNQRLGIDQPITFYEDILLYHFMEIASQGNDLRRFCRSEIRKIEEYDKKYDTSLKVSLEAYLEAGRNVQQAAGRLGIHKNTLRYRLERVEDLFELDLTDENTCFDLQFSLRMLRLIQ